jgi:chromosome segregation ATPase
MSETARQYDYLEKEQGHLKNNFKVHKEKIDDIDKRLIVLEQKTPEQLNHINWRLQSIENTLIKISDELKTVCSYFSEHKGGLTAKNKIWLIIYSVLTIGGLYLTEVVFKILGVNI